MGTNPGSRMTYPRVTPAGDEAVLIELGADIQPHTHRRIQELGRILATDEAASWLRELIPAYASILVHYDPGRIGYRRLERVLRRIIRQVMATDSIPRCAPRLQEIPIQYGGNDGPDLNWVADRAGTTPREVVERHCGPTYVVYMLGFTPGFCYLGDLPAELSVPRRRTPRLGLPAGAVAIGGRQTGIYSLDGSPGGWRWIGRTPLKLWDPDRNPPFLLKAGDRVRFVPI